MSLLEYYLVCCVASLQSMTSSTSTEDLKDGFDQIVTEMKSLRKLLSDSTSFLPYYTIRTFQQVR